MFLHFSKPFNHGMVFIIYNIGQLCFAESLGFDLSLQFIDFVLYIEKMLLGVSRTIFQIYNGKFDVL